MINMKFEMSLSSGADPANTKNLLKLFCTDNILKTRQYVIEKSNSKVINFVPWILNKETARSVYNLYFYWSPRKLHIFKTRIFELKKVLKALKSILNSLQTHISSN